LAYRLKQGVFRSCVRGLAQRKINIVKKAPSPTLWSIAELELPEFSGAVDISVMLQIAEGTPFCHNASWKHIQSYEQKPDSLFRVDRLCPMDIRTVWEPARLQHLTYLFAALRQEEVKINTTWCRVFARDEIISWLRRNPFLCGPHYLSAMECALRIPVFIYSLKLLDNLTVSDSSEIVSAVYNHAWWIERNLSLYSSLGNHTVSEAVGLIFAGALFRQTSQGGSWLDRGIALLLQELNHQVLPDGGPVEQSFSYHRFVLDLYWLAADFLERNKLRSCADIRSVLRTGEEFLTAMSHSPGVAPPVGDCDDGHAVAPGLSPKREPVTVALQGVSSFKESGYTVIRGTQGVVLMFDHGPLGMPPLHNHGHADALSITLSLDGIPLLVDPGTYRYNGEPEFRAYFRGTRAHNTVMIDGQDQALQKTAFIWQHPYRTGVVRNTQLDGLPLIEALHDGYARLTEQVRHKRTIVQVDGCHFVIRDSFWGEGTHQFEVNYHLHPDASVKRTDAWWRIEKSGKILFLKLDSDVEAISGQQDPLLGWFSDSYGSKRECTVLRSFKSGHPDEVTFVSVLCVASIMPRSREESVVCAITGLA